MRIRDWSAVVCSSDQLVRRLGLVRVEAVDAYMLGPQSMAEVAGEGGEGALGGRVGGQLGLAAMARHGDDVDDAACLAFAVGGIAGHQPYRFLAEKEGRAHVDREEAVPQLRRGVVDAAAVGDRKSVG